MGIFRTKFRKHTILLAFLILLSLSAASYIYITKNRQNQGNDRQDTGTDTESQPNPEELCIKECNELLNAGINLDAGPCILDPIPEINEWVCDVAHNPREEIDNRIENQCNAWHNNTAKHFIELTPECEFIKSA